eukprot:gnl/Spiro4/4860_TR2425_c0_g2_i1.p1 gnl/Spiro4/4860_TR2425_c0_g2~~gnl/Spiro4/4860_TR2425_c0_g2_i1.p1  ORF type:complete len:370 (-),score=78.55 gnl/Spiro4/4860_TR2425_c0_g2_i1:119-1228(-)
MTSNTLNIEFDYVETHHDEDLVCQLCMSPFVNPLTCPGCQQSCCASHTPLTNCPFCRESWTVRPPVLPPRALLNLLDRFLVRCPNSSCERGRGGAPLQRGDLPSHLQQCTVPCAHSCGELVAPRDVETHNASCAAFVLTCESPGCTHRAPRAAMPAHQAECPTAVVLCPHGCSYRGPRFNAAGHDAVCPSAVIACPIGCSLRLARGDVCSHSASCPEKVVVCASADVGCPYSAARKLLQEHELICVFHKDRRLILLERALALQQQALEAAQRRIATAEQAQATAEQAQAQQQRALNDATQQLARMFDEQGFAIGAVHKDTGTPFDAAGFNQEGFDREGFDRRGFDRRGLNRFGFNRRATFGLGKKWWEG